MLCKSCSLSGHHFEYQLEKHGNVYLASCTNPEHACSLWVQWNGKKWNQVVPKRYKNVSQQIGENVIFWDGGKEVRMKASTLRELRSSVMTKDGETLKGQSARNYIEKYSQNTLGKNLSGSYNSTEVYGYV